MKFEDLRGMPPFEALNQITGKFPQIKPEWGRHIVYRHGAYDGITSGALRWNGGLFPFQCFFDEDDYFQWPHEQWTKEEDPSEPIEMTREGNRYFVVTASSSERLRAMIRRHVSFCMNVNKGSDYRKKKYTGRSMPSNWQEWYKRTWPAVPPAEQYEGDIVAWFRK